jgi:thiol-disulfide isomerase/thioredoxin
MSKKKLFFNYFKHVPDDLVITSTPGIIISAAGTILLLVLFVFQLKDYLAIGSETTLVVDELIDDTLRVNFNVTLHEVPCEYLSVDVSDLTGIVRHNISKDILKWRLNSNQAVLGDSMAVAIKEAKADSSTQHENHDVFFDDEDAPEPADTKLSEHLGAHNFKDFLGQHELTLVNFFAPWCVWCRRLEPVYLEAANSVPSLHFHGHARLAQVDCVEHQQFCAKNMIRAYPTLRMYKDGNDVEFEAFSGSRTAKDILGFVQTQMDTYKKSHHVIRKDHSARFTVSHGALTAGNDLYRAKMHVNEAATYCGNNEQCAGFTWASDPKAKDKEKQAEGDGDADKPLIYFKGPLALETLKASINGDQGWSSYLKLVNATVPDSAAGSLAHGPEGCRVAGHLTVRKVPGTLKLVLHSAEHDHEDHLINSTHGVAEFWFGEPLSRLQQSRLTAADRAELASLTSHRIEGMTFPALHAGHSHVHYLKVVTRVQKHVSDPHDTISYKYTVHSNKFAAPEAEYPSIAFQYDLSPISIVVQQTRMPAYKFLTSSCAIIGGVFTVIGLVEGIIHHVSSSLLKKQI